VTLKNEEGCEVIQVCNGPESLSETAARLFVKRSRHAVQVQNQFSVVLAGGRTPERTYQILSRPPFRDQVPWAKAHVFWSDERCVPPDDPQSNAYMAHQALLDHVPIPPDQIHPICGQNPRQAAEEYEDLLRDFFAGRSPRFDFILLGLGENGHTASIFPGTQAVEEQEHWVIAVYVAEQAMWRITMTPLLINQAAMVAFLVAGTAKTRVLQRALDGPFEPHDLPAQLIQPVSGDLDWIVDEAAYRELIKTKIDNRSRSGRLPRSR
jgi:6-phosphogluconolactonase